MMHGMQLVILLVDSFRVQATCLESMAFPLKTQNFGPKNSPEALSSGPQLRLNPKLPDPKCKWAVLYIRVPFSRVPFCKGAVLFSGA